MSWKNVQYKDGKFKTGEGGGGGGSSTFAELDDVNFSNLQNGQVPKYNSTTQKWENANESGGGGTVTDVTVDGTSVVNPQGVAEIPAIPDGLHHYSTTEQVIGTWIDGKPLYEKTFQDVLPIIINGTNSSKSIDVSSLNISKVINNNAMVITSGGNYDLPYSYNDGYGGKCYYNLNNNSITVIANSGNMSESQFFVTIQYTKTTD